VTDDRLSELAANLEDVRARVAAACKAAERDVDDVTVIAVTKTWPADDVRRLAALGVGDIGENRDQEAAPKARACADLGLRWHFVGQLQTNKCRSVAAYAHAVHSIDRPRLVTALDDAAQRRGERLRCLIEVRLEERPGRAGASLADVARLADLIAGSSGLELAGVMGIAPLDQDRSPAFGRLAQVAEEVRQAHPDARWLSAGMSDDLEQAIAAGATHVRVGTALLGRRPPLR
jgi:pyridoxal phosphate enzyme (YggS family)